VKDRSGMRGCCRRRTHTSTSSTASEETTLRSGTGLRLVTSALVPESQAIPKLSACFPATKVRARSESSLSPPTSLLTKNRYSGTLEKSEGSRTPEAAPESRADTHARITAYRYSLPGLTRAWRPYTRHLHSYRCS
jgi:hypothetical protein